MVDYRSLPQTTIRKVIKKCLEDGTFDIIPFIPQNPHVYVCGVVSNRTSLIIIIA